MSVTVRYGRAEAYTQRRPGEPLRLYVAVRLQHGGMSLDTLGLIDSGADSSLFNAQYAQALGLDLAAAQPGRTRGVGGEASVWYFDIVLGVLSKRIPARVGFADTWTPEFGLLDRNDFFAAFRVGFEQRQLRVLLETLAP